MPLTIPQAISVIALTAAITFFCRALPFFFMRGDLAAAPWLRYLGRVLPGAIIPVLVIYCFRFVDPVIPPFGAPEWIAALLAILMHLWRRNNLLSIGVATAAYMIMVQLIFV
jgi:branched-subunit amino acid transport protein AzlD